MASDGNGVERTLGRILGKLEGIDRRLDKADYSRAGLYDKVEAVGRDVTAIKSHTGMIEGRVDRVKTDVEAMKPEVAMVRDAKKKAAGAVLVLGAVGAFLMWLVTAAMEPLMRLFR